MNSCKTTILSKSLGHELKRIHYVWFNFCGRKSFSTSFSKVFYYELLITSFSEFVAPE